MNAPIPRPIPIVLGDPHPQADVAVVLRVIERGQEDLHVQQILSGRRGGWPDELSTVLDRMIREARLWVGVRHGVWICHVVPFQFPYDNYATNVYVPPIAPVLRRREPREWRTIYDDSMLSFTPDMRDRYSQV